VIGFACSVLLAGGALAAPPSAVPRGPDERPLPAIEGYGLDGKRISISDYIGKRLVLFFFNPEVPDSAIVADAVRGIATERGKNNFEIVGIAIGSSRPKAVQFRDAHGLSDVPIIDDSSATITRQLGLQSPVMLIAADAEGYMTFGMAQFDTLSANPAQAIEEHAREGLRLPKRAQERTTAFGERPLAPLFEATRLAGGDSLGPARPPRPKPRAPDRHHGHLSRRGRSRLSQGNRGPTHHPFVRRQSAARFHRPSFGTAPAALLGARRQSRRARRSLETRGQGESALGTLRDGSRSVGDERPRFSHAG
jgi:peroxiredoxin